MKMQNWYGRGVVQRELLVAKRKKAKELHQKGWSIDKIAHHLVSSWRSVSHWIEMESIEEDNRGWKKGRLRKYDRQDKQRVIDIRQELRATESYFFGPKVVQANYRNLYPHLEPPTLYFITKTLTTGGRIDNGWQEEGQESLSVHELP